MRSKYIFFFLFFILIIISSDCSLNNPFQSTNLNDIKESSSSEDEDTKNVDEVAKTIEGDIRITETYGSSRYPKLVWTGIEFGLMWIENTYEHCFTIIKANGEKKIDDIVISDSGSARSSSILWDGSNYAIIYVVSDSTNYYLYFTKIDTNGNKVLPNDVLVDSYRKDEYMISYTIIIGFEWTGTEYGVFWQWRKEDARVFFTGINTNGSLSSTVQINLSYNHAVIGSGPTHLYATWNGSAYGLLYDYFADMSGRFHLYFCRISSSGTKLSDNRVIQNATQSWTVWSNLIWTGSEYRIFWRDNYRTSGWKLFSAVLNSTGVKQGIEFPVIDLDEPHFYISPAWNGSEFGMAWCYTGTTPKYSYFSRFNPDGTKISNDIMIPDEINDARSPSLVWTGKYYAVAWSDRRNIVDMYGSEIYFKFLK